MQCLGYAEIYSIIYIQVTGARKTILLTNIFSGKKCIFSLFLKSHLSKFVNIYKNVYCALQCVVSK